MKVRDEKTQLKHIKQAKKTHTRREIKDEMQINQRPKELKIVHASKSNTCATNMLVFDSNECVWLHHWLVTTTWNYADFLYCTLRFLWVAHKNVHMPLNAIKKVGRNREEKKAHPLQSTQSHNVLITKKWIFYKRRTKKWSGFFPSFFPHAILKSILWIFISIHRYGGVHNVCKYTLTHIMYISEIGFSPDIHYVVER